MKYAPFAVAAAAAVAFAQPAAAAITFNGGVTSVTANSADEGLVIYTFGHNSSFSFDLTNVGDSASVDLFFIGTEEWAATGADQDEYPIDVAFDFSSPFGGGSVGGTTSGFSVSGNWLVQIFNPCSDLYEGCGQANFTPTTFTFDDGTKLDVQLSNVGFTTPGFNKVTGTFTLVSPAVPEASTWAMMLAGFGALGFAMRRRRNVNVSFA